MSDSNDTCTYSYEDRPTGEIISCIHAKWQEDPDGLCIFHSKEIEAKQETFGKELDAYIQTVKSNEKQDFLCIGFVFPEIDFSEQTFNKPADFTECQFSGYANFNSSTFCEEVSFQESQFSKRADFSGSHFNGGTNFRNSRFRGWADFGKTEYIEFTDFNESKFSTYADFQSSHFRENASFRRSQFWGETNFSESKFSNKVDFGNSRFSGKTDFSISEFSGDTSFRKGHFDENVRFVSTLFRTEISFIQAKITNGEFNNTRFQGNIEFSSVNFMGTNRFEDIRVDGIFIFKHNTMEKTTVLNGCSIALFQYEPSVGEKLILDCIHYGNNEQGEKCATRFDFMGQDCSRLMFLNTDLSQANFLGARIEQTWFESCSWASAQNGIPYAQVCDHQPQAEKNSQRLQSLYCQLKKRYEEMKEYSLSGDFHYWEMDLREKSLTWEGHIMEKCLLKLYRRLGDFGENYLRLLLWILVPLPAVGLTIFAAEASEINEWLVNTLSGKIPKFFASYYDHFKQVLLAIVPTAVTNHKILGALSDFSKLILNMEMIFALIVVTLFIMAVRRRFRR